MPEPKRRGAGTPLSRCSAAVMVIWAQRGPSVSSASHAAHAAQEGRSYSCWEVTRTGVYAGHSHQIQCEILRPPCISLSALPWAAACACTYRWSRSSCADAGGGGSWLGLGLGLGLELG